MPATKTAKSKARSRSKPKSKAERKEINQRNAKRSTGPRTARGKGKSKYNAVTHGMTARSPLLPGEDADLLLARQRALRDDMQPRNRLEAELLDTVGAHLFRSDQAALAGDAWASKRIRHDAREQAKKEKAEVLKLGESLLWKPSLPLPTDQYSANLEMPPVADVDLHPRHPDRLLLELECTVAGCDWLLKRWDEVSRRLNVEGRWRPADAFTMIRLTGKHAIELEDRDDVARVLLCSLTLTVATQPGAQNEPFDWISALLVMLCSFKHEDTIKTAADVARFHYCEPFKCRLAELPLARLAPKGKVQARQWLIGVIEGQIKRVRGIRAELEEIADADEAEAPARLTYEIGPEGDKHRRYILSNGRQVSKSVNDFFKARTMSETGKFASVAADRHNRDEPAGLAPGVAIGPEKPVEVGETRQELAALDGNTPVDDDMQARPREATPVDVDGRTPASSHDQEASCDDDSILRNEATEFVRCPLSVVSGQVALFDEPGAPNAATNDRDDENAKTEIDREKAGKLIWDEAVLRAPIRAEDLRKMNEESRKDAQEARAADRRSRRRGKRSGMPGDRERTAPRRDQIISCDDNQILRNEANHEFVSGPLSVVSGGFDAIEEPSTSDEVTAVTVANVTDDGQRTTDRKATDHGPRTKRQRTTDQELRDTSADQLIALRLARWKDETEGMSDEQFIALRRSRWHEERARRARADEVNTTTQCRTADDEDQRAAASKPATISQIRTQSPLAPARRSG